MDLLMAQFNQFPRRLSKDDIETILSVDIELWDKKLKFKFKTDTEGNFYNEKLENEIIKRRNWTKSRKNNSPFTTNKAHMNPHMSTHMDTHMENENENENIIKKENIYSKTKKPKKDPREGKDLHLTCVYISQEEHRKLVARFGEEETKKKIYNLNNYMLQFGKENTYKSHYHTILNWALRDEKAHV